MLRNTLLNKKAELTFTQIIIAVISIIVLIVIVMIFTGSLSGPSDTLASCAVNNGKCVPKGECSGIARPGNYSDCTIDEPVCCITLFSSNENTEDNTEDNTEE